MARKKGSPPQYRRHKGAGRGYVTVDGRQHLFPGRFNSPESLAAYQRLLADWAANGGRLPVPRRAAVYTVANLIDEYKIHLRARHDETWQQNNLDRIGLALAPVEELFGPEPAAEFSPLRLQAVRDAMLATGRLCRKEINSRVFAIRKAFRWAVAQEKVPASVAHALAAVDSLRQGEFGAREGKKREPVDEATVLATLPYLSRELAAVVELLWWTGGRPSELLGLRPMDIDRTESLWIFRLGKHKTKRKGKRREITFGPRCQAILNSFLRRVPPPPKDKPLFSPVRAVEEQTRRRRQWRKTPLWPSHVRRYEEQRKRSPKRMPGDAYTANSLRNAVARAVRMANRDRAEKGEPPIKVWVPYQLRHSAASRLRRERGLESVRCVLGHASAATSEIYTQHDLEQARRVMQEDA